MVQAIGTVTSRQTWKLKNCGTITSKGAVFLSIETRPAPLWNPPSILMKRHRQ